MLASKSTQGSAFGVRTVVCIRARVTLTRKFCRACPMSPVAVLLRTIRSGFETTFRPAKRGQPSNIITSSNCLPLALCIFMTITPRSGRLAVAKCSWTKACRVIARAFRYAPLARQSCDKLWRSTLPRSRIRILRASLAASLRRAQALSARTVRTAIQSLSGSPVRLSARVAPTTSRVAWKMLLVGGASPAASFSVHFSYALRIASASARFAFAGVSPFLPL